MEFVFARILTRGRTVRRFLRLDSPIPKIYFWHLRTIIVLWEHIEMSSEIAHSAHTIAIYAPVTHNVCVAITIVFQWMDSVQAESIILIGNSSVFGHLIRR